MEIMNIRVMFTKNVLMSPYEHSNVPGTVTVPSNIFVPVTTPRNILNHNILSQIWFKPT